MAEKTVSTVGVEYDTMGIRAAKAHSTGSGKYWRYDVDDLVEVHGDYNKDEELVAGLQKIRTKLGIGSRDLVVSCVSGKQVYAAQMPFRRLGDSEMANALRFEIRKNAPFETAGSIIDYQILEEPDKKSDHVTVLVTAIASILLNKHLSQMEQAGLKPMIVEVLPVTVANVFWAQHQEDTQFGTTNIVTHFSPTVCTLVIDGVEAPFYTRSIYFAAEEVFGANRPETMTDRERVRRIDALGDELTRSLSFYEKTYGHAAFEFIHLLGEYCDDELQEALSGRLGLPVTPNNFLDRFSIQGEPQKGKFDAAIALSMRT